MKSIILSLFLSASCLAGDLPRVYSCFADRVPVLRGHVVVQTHLYLALINVEAKQAAFVGYRVSSSDFATDNVLSRNFHTPAELREIALESSDYRGSGFDIGHAYALASVSASRYASEVNSLAALFAQSPNLNRGPWLLAEKRIRELSHSGEVTVMAGQLWLEEMPPLVAADEPHLVASHNWIWFRGSGIEEAYLFAQKQVSQSDDLQRYRLPPESLRDRVSADWWEAK